MIIEIVDLVVSCMEDGLRGDGLICLLLIFFFEYHPPLASRPILSVTLTLIPSPISLPIPFSFSISLSHPLPFPSSPISRSISLSVYSLVSGYNPTNIFPASKVDKLLCRCSGYHQTTINQPLPGSGGGEEKDCKITTSLVDDKT